jgi:hypothetical protein
MRRDVHTLECLYINCITLVMNPKVVVSSFEDQAVLAWFATCREIRRWSKGEIGVG